MKKNTVIVSASPKANQSRALSEYLAILGKNMIESELISVELINVKAIITQNTRNAYKMMLESDSLVIVFPLYIYSLPAILMRFLQDYCEYVLEHGNVSKTKKVFAVVNCGFPKPDICNGAIKIIENFSQKIGARFCLGVQIGGGGTILYTKDEPFMQKTMTEIKEAFINIKAAVLLADTPVPGKRICIQSGIEKEQYFEMGNKQWIKAAAKNCLTEEDLYRRVYIGE